MRNGFNLEEVLVAVLPIGDRQRLDEEVLIVGRFCIAHGEHEKSENGDQEGKQEEKPNHRKK